MSSQAFIAQVMYFHVVKELLDGSGMVKCMTELMQRLIIIPANNVFRLYLMLSNIVLRLTYAAVHFRTCCVR